MEIETLRRLATADFLNGMIERHDRTGRRLVSHARAQPAEMPYLKNGGSRNGWFLDVEITPTDDAEISIPRHLVLKAGRNTEGQAEQEISFYQLARGADLPIARCYGTGWLEAEEIALLLLETVPADHFYFGPDPARLPQYQQACRSLARLHAWRWNHPSLGQGRFEYRWSNGFIENIMVLVQDGLAKFKASDHGVDPVAISRIARVLEQLPSLLSARVREEGPMCINHGDAGLWNFMFQDDPQAPAVMLDFPQWCVNPPSWDLVYMTALDWPTGFRRAHEQSLVAAYRSTLGQLGIEYASETFDLDRKLCALGMAGVAMVSLATGARSSEESAVEVQRLLAVLEDYGALELLG